MPEHAKKYTLVKQNKNNTFSVEIIKEFIFIFFNIFLYFKMITSH